MNKQTQLPQVFAAGTVCWRRNKTTGKLEVLLVYRRRYADWSFPKGKLDAGETLPQAAVRETMEETGYRVHLGVNIGTISYLLKTTGQPKTVAYWAAHISSKTAKKHTFEPNKEIAEIAWLPLKTAKKRLTYKRERDILEIFCALAAAKKHSTFALVLLRHAKAEPRSAVFPVDRLRPLADLGADQAQLLIPSLAAFGPQEIITSDAKRCRATVVPVAHSLQLPLLVTAALSQDTWETGLLDDLRELAAGTVKSKTPAIICSHRPVLPDIAREIAFASGAANGAYLQEATALPPAGFAVFHLTRKTASVQLVSVESYPLKA